jgi:hypothetical protein
MMVLLKNLAESWKKSCTVCATHIRPDNKEVSPKESLMPCNFASTTILTKKWAEECAFDADEKRAV